MKQIYTLIFIPLFLINGVLSQEFDLTKDDPEYICKYYHSDGSVNLKSEINPNPLVYQYDIKFYKLNLEAYDTTDQFSGYARILAQVTVNQLDTFSMELSDKLAVDSVLINGTKLSYTHTSDNIYVELPSPLLSGDFVDFLLYYHTPPDYSSIYYTVSENPNYGNFKVAQTFSEPYFMHEWAPAKQDLQDKADSVHIFITTNNDLKVAGPGLLTEVPLPDNKMRFEWRTNIPTAFYLIFFAVSDYQEYDIYAKPDSLPGDSILIMNYLFDYPNLLETYKNNIDKTTGMIEQLSGQYGLFPFHEEKYGHYMWYPANFSGMEHITMTGLRGYGVTLIAHELGHSWFGDNVTCASWSDIWINEGFASYTEYLVQTEIYGKAVADAQMLTFHNYVMNSPGGSVYVPESSLHLWGRIFSTRLTYRKGSALVHMIRYIMNDDSLFFSTLYEFQQEYADSVATGADFRDMCQQVSGIDFTTFFDQWYYGEGFPVYDLTWWQDMDTVYLSVDQTTSTAVTPFFDIPMEYKLTFDGGDTLFRFEQHQNDTIYKIILPEDVTGVEIDPDNWVLNQVGALTHHKLLDLKVFLEGPYNENSGTMTGGLNPSYIPLNQPYNQAPWNYTGSESMGSIPDNTIVDWMLVAIYDTTVANLSTEDALTARQAVLVKEDGTLVQTDGTSKPYFDQEINNDLFVAVYHRNHLPVLSAIPLTINKGVYTYDFTGSDLLLYGDPGGYSVLDTGTWGMTSGDANSDGIIDNTDKSSSWEPNGGTSGYLRSDLNLDGQTDNLDKDDQWLPNLGKASQLPQ